MIPFVVISSIEEGHCLIVYASQKHSALLTDLLNRSEWIDAIGYEHRESFIIGMKSIPNCTIFDVTARQDIEIDGRYSIESIANVEMLIAINKLCDILA